MPIYWRKSKRLSPKTKVKNGDYAVPFDTNLLFSFFAGLASFVASAYQVFEKDSASFALFKEVFYANDLPMVVVGLDERPVYVNHACERWLGYSELELQKMQFKEFTHRDDIDIDIELFGEVVAGQRERYLMKKRWYDKRDILRWGILSCHVIRDDKTGDILAVLAIIKPLETDDPKAQSLAKIAGDMQEKPKESNVFLRAAMAADNFRRPGLIGAFALLGILIYYLTLGGGIEAFLKFLIEYKTTPSPPAP